MKAILKKTYPFSAIVGQEEMKLALMLAAVSPAVSGVLLRGEKGSGKSTAARALARILPEVEVIKGCPFGSSGHDPLCHLCKVPTNCRSEGSFWRPAPFVNLPLSITDDALFGAIDLDKALKEGRKCLRPGLLARANHGVLYIDEVNLLEDHLVAGLLNVAENGINIVERESLSLVHPARFILIGSMNPEEGELSPQFLDRFGLCVSVKGEKDPGLRSEIIRRRLLFEKDPLSFSQAYESKEAELRNRIREARNLYPSVAIPRHIRSFIAEVCRENNVPGHRADLILQTAATARAALEGRLEVKYEDVEAVAEMVLRHRRREAEARSTPPKDKQEILSQASPSKTRQDQTPDLRPEASQDRPPKEAEGEGRGEEAPHFLPPQEPKEHQGQDSQDQVFKVGNPFRVRSFGDQSDRRRRVARTGRRSSTLNKLPRGRFVRAVIPKGPVRDLAIAATVRAAAIRQVSRGQGKLIIREEDLRQKLRKTKTGHLLLFCLDGSGSMGAEARMTETKGAILSLLLSAYQHRDRVGLMIFRGQEAQLVLPPTNSVELAARLLETLPVGGSTPLSAALARLGELLRQKLRQDPDLKITVILITDGRGNVSLTGENPRLEVETLAQRLSQTFPQVEFVVIDTEVGSIRLEMARRLAAILSARYFTPEALRAEEIARIARQN
ncbi:ATP-binding protein [Thermosulfuriphilus sp.]